MADIKALLEQLTRTDPLYVDPEVASGQVLPPPLVSIPGLRYKTQRRVTPEALAKEPSAEEERLRAALAKLLPSPDEPGVPEALPAEPGIEYRPQAPASLPHTGPYGQPITLDALLKEPVGPTAEPEAIKVPEEEPTQPPFEPETPFGDLDYELQPPASLPHTGPYGQPITLEALGKEVGAAPERPEPEGMPLDEAMKIVGEGPTGMGVRARIARPDQLPTETMGEVRGAMRGELEAMRPDEKLPKPGVPQEQPAGSDFVRQLVEEETRRAEEPFPTTLGVAGTPVSEMAKLAPEELTPEKIAETELKQDKVKRLVASGMAPDEATEVAKEETAPAPPEEKEEEPDTEKVEVTKEEADAEAATFETPDIPAISPEEMLAKQDRNREMLIAIEEGLRQIGAGLQTMAGAPTEWEPSKLRDQLSPSDRKFWSDNLGIDIPKGMTYDKLQKLTPTLAQMQKQEAKQAMKEANDFRKVMRKERVRVLEPQPKSPLAVAQRNLRKMHDVANLIGTLEAAKSGREEDIEAARTATGLMYARMAKAVAGDVGNLAEKEQARAVGLIGIPGLLERWEMLRTGKFSPAKIDSFKSIIEKFMDLYKASVDKEYNRYIDSLYESEKKNIERLYAGTEDEIKAQLRSEIGIPQPSGILDRPEPKSEYKIGDMVQLKDGSVKKVIDIKPDGSLVFPDDEEEEGLFSRLFGSRKTKKAERKTAPAKLFRGAP